MIRTLVPAPYIRRYAHQSDITTERRSPALPTPHRPRHQRPCRVHLEPCRPSAGPTPLAPARPSAPSVSPSRASRRVGRPHLGQEPPGGHQVLEVRRACGLRGGCGASPAVSAWATRWPGSSYSSRRCWVARPPGTVAGGSRHESAPRAGADDSVGAQSSPALLQVRWSAMG
jgi:hypothetical protein